MERNPGEREHSSAQGRILIYLTRNYPHLLDLVLPEQCVQVTPSRFRIPDICVLSESAPWERIIRTAPELCIEILSPEDSLSRVTDRLRDYLEMGVPVCWVIDPVRERGWTAWSGGPLEEVSDGMLRARGIEMPLLAACKKAQL